MSTGQRSFRFIDSNHSKDARSANIQRRAVHSHAAKATHAKARRRNMIEYQAKRDSQLEASKNESSLSRSNVAGMKMPSPISLLSSDRRDPFDCAARPLKPVEHFLLDHYVTVVIPYMNTVCNRITNPVKFLDLMTREWVRLTLTNSAVLCGVFLASCRHLLLDDQHQQLAQLAIHYKVACMRALREAIAAETSTMISDSTVALGILLAYEEMQIGNVTTTQGHLRGLVDMVEHNGGPHTLGANGFLERLVGKFVLSVKPACRYELKPLF